MSSCYGVRQGDETLHLLDERGTREDGHTKKPIMSIRIILITCVLLMLALGMMSGCGSSQQQARIIGEWDVAGTDGMTATVEGQLSADADGAVVIKLEKQGFMGTKTDMTYEGTWKTSSRKSIAGSEEATGDSEIYEITLGKDTYAAAVAVDEDGNETFLFLAEVVKDGKTTVDASKLMLTGERVGAKSLPSAEELDAQIAQQPVFVSSVRYFDGETEVGNSYENFLIATIQNNSDTIVKSASIGWVAWDANGYPVEIDGWGSGHDDEYVVVDMDHINLEPGQAYDKGGLKLGTSNATGTEVATFKAIVASYETMDGEKWSNPLLSDWKKLYEGVPQNG